MVVDRITVFSGERYDFVLEAKEAVDNYWIRAAGGQTCQEHQVYIIISVLARVAQWCLVLNKL